MWGLTDSQIANLVAILALIATIVFGVAQSRKPEVAPTSPGEESERLAKLQRERLEREEAEKNRVQLAVYWHNAGNCKGVNVKNVGHRNAHNVNFVFLEDERIVTSLVMNDFHEKFPVKCLIPQEEQTFLIVPCQDTGVSWRYRLTWVDEEGKSYECEGKISIG